MPDYPRVTTLISDMGLMGGSAFYQPKHRRRGRYVHYWAHVIAQGGEVEADWLQRSSGDKGQDDWLEHREVLPYLDGVKKALSDNDIQVHQWELEVINDHLKYLGHLDWLGIVQGKPAIVDLKCGAQAEWHRIQTALYSLAAFQTNYNKYKDTTLYQRWALYVGPVWGDRLYKLVRHDDPYDYKAAEHLALAWWDRGRYGQCG